MIKPTVGRVVWYHRRGVTDNVCAAIVCFVWNDRMVNLAAFDTNGNLFPATSVTLVQEGDAVPLAGPYCEWMPYQKQVASGALAPTLHT